MHGVAAAALVLVTVLALPGVAQAAPLTTTVVAYGSTIGAPPPGASTWDFTTTAHFWSVVAVYSDSDYDLALSGNGAYLGWSTFGGGITDFVAFDNNDGRWPVGNYHATVNRYSGTADFAVEEVEGYVTGVLPVPTHDGTTGVADPDIGFASIRHDKVVNIEDIYLAAGESFWVNTSHPQYGPFFLESNPDDSSTWTRSRASAVNSGRYRVVDGCTVFTAKYSGWHALVSVNDYFPRPSDPFTGDGSAVVTHRYSPDRPDSCPIKNFPSATP